MPRLPASRWLPSPQWAVAALALLMTVALVAGTVLVLAKLRADVLERSRAEIRGVSEVLAEQSSRAFEGAAVALLAAQYRLSDVVGQSLGLDSFPVRALLGARTAGLPQVRSLFVLDTHGQTVNTSLPSGPPSASLADRDYFRYFAQGGDDIFISAPVHSRADGKWTVIMAVRLVDDDDRFRGVLSASLEMDYFESFYGGLDFVDRLRVKLVDARSGIVLAAPMDRELVGRSLPGVPAVLHEANSERVLESVETFNQQPRYMAWKPVPGYPFIVVVGIDEDMALHTWPATMRTVATGAAVVVLLVLVAATALMLTLGWREQMAHALRETDERSRRLIQTVNDAIVTMDEQFTVTLFNPAAEAMFGCSAEAAVGQPFTALLAPASRHACVDILERCRTALKCESLGLTQPELSCVHAAGHEFPAHASFSTTLFRGQRLYTVVLRDLSERRRIEADLRATNQRLRALSVQLQNVREEERAGIAREMHDELGQLLTGIKLELSWLRGRMPAEHAELRRKVELIQEQLAQTIRSVRRITAELRPLILDDLGLIAAISWLVEDFSQRTGVEVVLELGHDEPPRGSVEATALFRVLQEALTNVTKYAQADTVWVNYRREGDDWVLSVKDDGVGFELDATRQSGFGLVSMRERARLAGGDLQITTTPGEGVTVEARIPLVQGE